MAPPSPPAEPSGPPRDPRAGWARLLKSLSPFSANTVHERAGFEGYAEGVLTLLVRSDRDRGWVRDQLRAVDFSLYFAGFRNLDVRIATEGGATGRERREAGDEKRRTEAQAQAEASPLVRQLLEAFGGKLEAVEPAAQVVRDIFGGIEEVSDE